MKYSLLSALLILCSQLSFASSVNVPVSERTSEAGAWELLTYKKIKPNKVNYLQSGLMLIVKESASPFIFKLKKPQKFKSAEFQMEFNGSLKLKKNKQGGDGNDDSLMRFGVVYEGKRTLNFLQRSIAAPWVLRLFQLAPKGVGVSGVEFFNVVSDKRMMGVKRTHPSADVFKENFVVSKEQIKQGTVKVDLNPNKRVLALWLSADGDDTKSSFDVLIKQIKLTQ